MPPAFFLSQAGHRLRRPSLWRKSECIQARRAPVGLDSQQSQISDREELSADGKTNSDAGAWQHFVRDGEESWCGDRNGKAPAARKLRSSNVIERCLVEVRRRTRPMLCFVKVQGMDRIAHSICTRCNPQCKNRPLLWLHQQLDFTLGTRVLDSGPKA